MFCVHTLAVSILSIYRPCHFQSKKKFLYAADVVGDDFDWNNSFDLTAAGEVYSA